MTRSFIHLAFLGSLALSCGYAAAPQSVGGDAPGKGELVYNVQCASCHGRKGNMGVGGAKDLVMSTLSRDSMIAVVTHGRGAMMPYGAILDREQVNAVVDHAMGMRKAAGAEGTAK